MKELIGFVGLHALLVWSGLALLRAFGLVPSVLGIRLFLALGPAFLVGTALVVVLLIFLLVVGVPLTLVTATLVAVGSAGIAEIAARRRRPITGLRSELGLRRIPARSRLQRWLSRVGFTAAGVYAALGAYALARLPTVGDDARIWSLRGLTLAYYHRLQPEIFLNPLQAGAHPVYPLFQPVLEVLLSLATGHPQLRFVHTELWLLFVAVVWTAAFMIRDVAVPVHRSFWCEALVLLAVSPAAVNNLTIGDADITGAALLATGALALGLWIEREDDGYLAPAAVLLAAAANVKDEDLLSSVLVLLMGGAASLPLGRNDAQWTRGAARRLRRWAGATATFAVLVAPWRLWVAAHHLSDSVQPPLPDALSPTYVLSRTDRLRESLHAMLTETLTQWGWLAAIFAALCIICLVTRTARRTVCFYLIAVAAVVCSLLWLYTMTPLSLGFLIPTSMGRTVDVFMVLAALASAHLLAALVRAPADTSRSSGS